MESAPGQETSGEEQAAEEEGQGSLQPKELLLFAVRAIRQDLGLCLLVASVVALLGSTIVAAIPLSYESTFRIFVQEGGALTTSLASGKERYAPIDVNRGLQEYLLARDNLLSVVREAKLVDSWPLTRPLPMRLKDRVSAALVGPPLRKDMERSFVEMLSGAIVGAVEGASVRVRVQWRDGQSAYEIARLVQRNFLAARAAHDFGPFQRAIPFLEAQLEEADKAVLAAGAHLNESKAPAAPHGAPAAQGDGKASPNAAALIELASVSRRLAEVRRQQRTLIGPWEQRISDLKTQLVDAKASYSDDHPKVLQLEARIAAASEVPEELAELRSTEAELKATLANRKSGAAGGASEQEVAAILQGGGNVTEDAKAAAEAQTRFLGALRRSEEFSNRLESARIELAAAQAEFEHHYVVIEQPEIPGQPLKNKKPLLFLAVFVVSLLLGVAAATAREFIRGRVSESWQVRSLGLPVLAEVELRRLPPPSDPS